MPALRELHIFQNSVQFLNMYHAFLTLDNRIKCVEALSLIADSEDFSTFKTQYIPDATTAEHLINLNNSCLTELASSSPENRRLLRPLVDLSSQMKRKFRLK